MDLSPRVLSLSPSATLAITAKAAEMRAKGKDVISLSAGEPDFDTPDFIKQAAIEALQKGMTRYTPATGTPELKKAVSEKLLKDQKLNIPADQIVISSGAKHSIFNVLFALVSEGDEVLIPAPFWLSYPEMVTCCGAKSVIVQTTQEQSFKLTPEALEKAITSRSKVLILNSPSNPTGAVYSEAEFKALIAVLKKHPQIVVLSDEIYEKLIFDGQKHFSIASLDQEIASRTVVVNGMSKAYAMTGWRLGYAAFPDKALAKAVASFQSHSTSNPTSFAQAGGVAALQKGDEAAENMRQVFEKRRNRFVSQLSEFPQFKPFMPQGAFYVFMDIQGTGMNSMELATLLLEKTGLAVVPGAPFGSDGHIRMSFATSDANLDKAITRMGEWLHAQKQ
ncbi:MAG: pyridoxal phosphate-dependent aminotransferase [Candidatus Omnitrophica bacterium]|nr:pyridoxal phosphate-dependent aminotransferase [Candidatus Omnitrophota bacterium]